MGRNFVITEEQYERLNGMIDEVDVKADVKAANGDIKTAVEKANKEGVDSGLKPGKFGVVVNSNDVSQNVAEGRLITKKQLQENRLKKFKKNSEFTTVKDLLKKYK